MRYNIAMPLYEYFCSDCRLKFTALRPMREADEPIACEECEGQRTSRVLSVFFAHSTSAHGETPGLGGGCACGGACSCGHSHH